MALTLTTSFDCTAGAGYAHLTAIGGPGDRYLYSLTRLSDGFVVENSSISRTALPLDFDNLYDDQYELRLADVDDPDNVGVARLTLACGYPNPNPGGGGGGALTLDRASATNETAAGSDGTATIQASGGLAPLTATLVDLGISQAAASGQPSTFPGLPASTYRLRVTDSSSPVQQVEATVTVGAYVAPKVGCQDEYATNYDPAATSPGACTYDVNWRSAWGPAGVAVPVPALPGQVKAYTEALLRIGFRPGHPLAASRPLGPPIRLRATVGPSGYAVFGLGPYLRPALGAPDGAAGYRLDLNSPTAHTDDLFVGYELRRPTGELLEHGYALNSAVPDSELGSAQLLSPFPLLPAWPEPTFEYEVSALENLSASRYGTVLAYSVFNLDFLRLPCPPNPLPVRWLAPRGGYAYWVFQGRPQIGDDVAESQAYNEAGSGERRYSQRGEARGTVTASTGVFNGPRFADGLRTLWASPQVWLLRGKTWVAVTLEGGSFPVRRMGLPRTEISVVFTESKPHYAQGQ